MPELPEVETIRRQLNQKIVGKKLNGKKISAVRRRAKLLIIDFVDSTSLVFHLKMTGQLIFNGEPLKYTRHIFKFNDGSKLLFNDARKFGWWRELKNTKEIEKPFGPEVLEVNLQTFKERLKKHLNSRIKLLLLDQKFIAGIGNIYSDEILFASKIHPLRKVSTLNDKEIKQILENSKKILKKAIKYRGTTQQDYRDALGKEGQYQTQLKVYQKKGKKCERCQTKIERIKIGSRSAHFCPKCQKI
ncbi:MAG: DNA-formamidopyrimidine glycosylase [Candidatus Nealsonbacteria bacterium]